MAPDIQPPFPKYLLPSISLPFRGRHSSTTSTTSTSTDRVPSLSSSPVYSPANSPSSSPPTAHFITTSPFTAHSALERALQGIPKKKEEDYTTSNATTGLRRTAPNTLKCVTCTTDIAFASQIVSKGFTGRHGRAYLVSPPSMVYTTSTAKTKKEKENELVNTKLGRSATRELLTGSHVVADVSCVICGAVLGWKYVDARESAQRYKIGKFILEMKRVVLGVSWEDEGDIVDEVDPLEVGDGGAGDDDIIVFDSEDEDECEDIFAGVWDAEVVAKRRSRQVGGVRKKDILAAAR
ncbi:yippee zinc-binding/DNA-binding /Mis18, centromere assembly-domain-containing protein [Tricladium varicosporioides]|nr:yippee zinc-binding/DNA-binding /Mis18, centromere assembly-domain-containing protein [Hymenoscyphus varicosporioides]